MFYIALRCLSLWLSNSNVVSATCSKEGFASAMKSLPSPASVLMLFFDRWVLMIMETLAEMTGLNGHFIGKCIFHVYCVTDGRTPTVAISQSSGGPFDASMK
jgi:hypothetical protein